MTDIKAAADQLIVDQDLFHQIVHGDDTVSVTTESGPRKSLAGEIKEQIILPNNETAANALAAQLSEDNSLLNKEAAALSETNSAASAAAANQHQLDAESAKAAAETAEAGAQLAESNAVAVVTGGTASLPAAPGLIPIAGADGLIDDAWLSYTIPALSAQYPGLNVVDAVYYDTSKDSDGGAWIKKTGDLSYGKEVVPSGRYVGQYASGQAQINDAPNIAEGDWWYRSDFGRFWMKDVGGNAVEIFRAGSANFPSQVLIVATADQITIFDASGSEMTMWMVFRPVTCGNISIMESKLLFTLPAAGVSEANFANDTTGLNIRTAGSLAYFPKPIADRNVATPPAGTVEYPILSNSVYDVELTVLSDAPFDPETGLKIPTIIIPTSGGISIIHNDGTVVNWTEGQPTWLERDAELTGTGDVAYTVDDGSDFKVVDIQPIGKSTYGILDVNSNGARRYGQSSLPQGSYGSITGPQLLGESESEHLLASKLGSEIAVGNTTGMSFLHENISDPSKGMVAHITDTYNTGWMEGETEVALCESLTDRSGNATVITDNGVAVIEPASTGSEQKKITATGGTLTAPVTTGGATYGWELISGSWIYRANTGWAGVSESGGVLTIADGTVFSMLRYTNGAGPSADQHIKIESDEKRILVDDSYCLLDGNDPDIKALAYDKERDLLHAGSASVVSSFRGLECVNSITPAVGTISALDAQDGSLVISGSTGVDVSIPAVSIRERLAQALPKPGAQSEDFFFTGDGTTPDFALPKGWKPKRAWLDGGKVRKGSAEDYIIKHDGFIYSVSFAVAPVLNAEIDVEGVSV